MTDVSELSRAGRTELLGIINQQQEEIRKLCAPELAKRDAQIAELQSRMTEMMEAQLSRRVRAFCLKFGHPVAWTPGVPEANQVRFRLNLITEEYFELLTAAGLARKYDDIDSREPGDLFGVGVIQDNDGYTHDPRLMILDAIKELPINVNLPEFVDAIEDMKYVLEGTDAVFGVDADPIAAEVHRANLAKDPVYVSAKDAFHNDVTTIKPVKPPGWTPPDIEGALLRQGWQKP